MHHLVPGGLALHGDLHQDLLSALACQRAAPAGSGGHLGAVSQGGAVFSHAERFLFGSENGANCRPIFGDMGSHKTIGMGGETSILFTETPIFSGTKEVITYITFGTSPFSIGDLLIPCGRSVHASFSTPSLGCCWDTA